MLKLFGVLITDENRNQKDILVYDRNKKDLLNKLVESGIPEENITILDTNYEVDEDEYVAKVNDKHHQAKLRELFERIKKLADSN